MFWRKLPWRFCSISLSTTARLLRTLTTKGDNFGSNFSSREASAFSSRSRASGSSPRSLSTNARFVDCGQWRDGPPRKVFSHEDAEHLLQQVARLGQLPPDLCSY